MSQATSGPCLVCGEETMSRCEACRRAGIGLFFCSKKHQKLLWPMHKRVCGPKANPFTWPGFSKEEVEKMKNGLHFPPSVGRESLAESLIHAFNIPESLLEHTLDMFVDGAFNPNAWATTQHTILHLRFKEACRVVTDTNEPLRTVEEVFRYCAPFALFSIGDALSPDKPLPSYYSRCQHLLLAYAYLSYLVETASTPKDRWDLAQLREGAQQRFVHLVQRDVRAENPGLAEEMLRAFHQASKVEPFVRPFDRS
ncbi:hypothetical protein JCM8097_007699 [Rhodosporidiobolus ruineniae]